MQVGSDFHGFVAKLHEYASENIFDETKQNGVKHAARKVFQTLNRNPDILTKEQKDDLEIAVSTLREKLKEQAPPSTVAISELKRLQSLFNAMPNPQKRKMT